MDIEDLNDEFEFEGMSLRLDNSSYETLCGGVPEGAIGWRSLLDYLELELGQADFIELNQDDSTKPEAIYGYRRTEEQPHWLLVAFATSELHEKHSDIPEQSGWGYELTLRFAADTREPPQEAIEIINTLVEYVTEYQAPLAPNHTLDLGGLLDDTAAEARGFVALRQDPELQTALTPNGDVSFLQIVVTSEAEQEAMFDWDNEKMLDLLRESFGNLLISDPNRPCYLEDRAHVQFVKERIEKEGSSGELLFAAELIDWKEPRLGMSARLILWEELVPAFAKRLKGRILFERPLQVYGEEFVLDVVAAEMSKFETVDGSPKLQLTASACHALIEHLELGALQFDCPEVPNLVIKVNAV